MLKIGLTGGIGSGKSTVAKIFEALGIPVYYADIRARNLLNNDPALKEKIIANFGTEAYGPAGFDRNYISGIVFNKKEKLDLLNSLTHPATIADADRWMELQTAPYVIKEAAILFESGAARHLDKVIGVYAPQHLRIERVMKRDGLNVDEIMKRMSRQIDEETKMRMCDYVITNNEQELVIPQVLKLHEHFVKG